MSRQSITNCANCFTQLGLDVRYWSFCVSLQLSFTFNVEKRFSLNSLYLSQKRAKWLSFSTEFELHCRHRRWFSGTGGFLKRNNSICNGKVPNRNFANVHFCLKVRGLHKYTLGSWKLTKFMYVRSFGKSKHSFCIFLISLFSKDVVRDLIMSLWFPILVCKIQDCYFLVYCRFL